MKNRGFEILNSYLDQDIHLPRRSTKLSAGYDIEAAEEAIIEEGETFFVKTGLKAYMKEDEVLKVYARSSLATKRGLTLINGVGIIDADYYNNESNEGHILVALHNLSKETQVVKKGERIAQGIFERFLTTDDDQPVQVKRTGGFGSSNK